MSLTYDDNAAVGLKRDTASLALPACYLHPHSHLCILGIFQVLRRNAAFSGSSGCYQFNAFLSCVPRHLTRVCGNPLLHRLCKIVHGTGKEGRGTERVLEDNKWGGTRKLPREKTTSGGPRSSPSLCYHYRKQRKGGCFNISKM